MHINITNATEIVKQNTSIILDSIKSTAINFINDTIRDGSKPKTFGDDEKPKSTWDKIVTGVIVVTVIGLSICCMKVCCCDANKETGRSLCTDYLNRIDASEVVAGTLVYDPSKDKGLQEDRERLDHSYV